MVQESEEDHVKLFLKKSFNRWILPHINNSRRQQVIEIDRYHNKAWLLEAADNDSSKQEPLGLDTASLASFLVF